MEQAVAERLILVNPAKGCKLPKLEKREMKVLPEEKIRPYLMEIDKRGLLAAFYLELTTGLRRGELLALLWTDLDVEKRTISITKQVNRIKGELVVSLLVEEHKKHPGNPYMFPSPKTGGMFDPDSFRHTHDKILKAIGAEHIRFHDLRHTYVSINKEMPSGLKKMVIGHSEDMDTEGTYSHVMAGNLEKAANYTEEALNSILKAKK